MTMSEQRKDDEIRDHVGIAIDGGGIKGAIVAQGLIELEQILGVDRLIESERIKVVAGTSTGALIATAIVAGLSGAEILDLYNTASTTIFSKPGPLRPLGCGLPFINRLPVSPGLLRSLARLPWIGDLLVYGLFPARYSFDPLRAKFHEILALHPCPTADPTIGELGEHLRATTHGPTLIITASEMTEQRTHFIKTSEEEKPLDKNMKLVDAMLASACIPTYFPPISLIEDGQQRWLVDGGVGNFGNPALVAAWELCHQKNPDRKRRYPANDATVFSFGTGVSSKAVNDRVYRNLPKWWALDWLPRVLDVFMASAIRQQSRNIILEYPGIDLRRFQVELPQMIGADRFDLIDTILKEKGAEMRELIRGNRHALHPDPEVAYDPERIRDYIDLT